METNSSQIILYQTDDGRIRVEVRFEHENVWLTQKLIAELFDTTVANINIHLKNIFQFAELQQDSVIKDFLITASDGKKYKTKMYALEAEASKSLKHPKKKEDVEELVFTGKSIKKKANKIAKLLKA